MSEIRMLDDEHHVRAGFPERCSSLAYSWRADDHGVFALLDPMMPSRLLGAFPEGVEIQRVGLAEAVRGTRAFFRTACG